jgi:hypothetical protein
MHFMNFRDGRLPSTGASATSGRSLVQVCALVPAVPEFARV